MDRWMDRSSHCSRASLAAAAASLGLLLSIAAILLSISVSRPVWIVSTMASQRKLNNALIVASLEGRIDEIESLLDRHANINAVDICKDTPLHWASKHGRHQCIELLLDRHANIDAVDVDKYTPLHWASRNGHHQCIKLLLDRHANVNALAYHKYTPLHAASLSGHRQCIEILIDHGASKSTIDVRHPPSLSLNPMSFVCSIAGVIGSCERSRTIWIVSSH